MASQPPHPATKALRTVKGSWSAGGHSFDDSMRCTYCRRSWTRHQVRPSHCQKARELVRTTERKVA